MSDDLLLTNSYISTENTESSDTKIFTKLMNAKDRAKNTYSKHNPEFTQNIETNRDTGLSINEDSVAFEQFLKFAQTDKKKKVKKTILNIDSRNRNTTYTYDQLSILYDSVTPLEFINNKSTFIINTNKINYIDDITIYKQVILTNLNNSDFDKVGVKKGNFEFNINNGTPIFDILTFIYVDGTGKELINKNTYDNSRNQYKFNKCILSIPHNIDSSEIKTVNVGTDIKLDIITNVNISYPSPSHYFINLGKTYSNIYSIRLVSSEIPNTSYTFNENLIETNFGQFKLSTKQNNKLRWINKTDRVHILNNNILKASIFHENIPILPIAVADKYHISNYEKLKRLCNINLNSITVKVVSTSNVSQNVNSIDGYTLQNDDFFIIKNQNDPSENGVYKYSAETWGKQTDATFVHNNNVPFIYYVDAGNGTDSVSYKNNYKYYEIRHINGNYEFTEIDYINNLRRIYSLIYLSRNITNSYYVNHTYIGDFVTDSGGSSLIGLNDTADANLFISDTIYTFNTNLIYNLAYNLDSFYFYKGYNISISDESYTKFNFTTNESTYNASNVVLDIELYSNAKGDYDDFCDFITKNINLPTKIIFNSLAEDSDLRYIFYLYKITDKNVVSSTPKKTYKLDLVPINGSFDENIPFKSYTDTDTNGINMVVFNEISSENIFNYMKYKPDIWTLMKNYYLTSEICLYPIDSQPSNDYTRTFLITTAANNEFQMEFKTYHTFTFTNTPTFKQVKISGSYAAATWTNPSIQIYFIDSNSNSVSDISNIAGEYTYLKINNNLFPIDTTIPITYDTDTKYYSIPFHGNGINDTKGKEFEQATVVNLYFQKDNIKEVQYLYLDNLLDYSNKILRIYEDNTMSYIEYYVADNEIIDDYNKYEVRYKNDFLELNLNSGNKKFNLFKEYNSIFMRDFVGSYIVTEYNNINYKADRIRVKKYDLGLDQKSFSTPPQDVQTHKAEGHAHEHYNANYNILNMHNNNILNKNFKSDMVDITTHDIIAITNKNINNGINEISFAKEFVTTNTIDNVYVNPKINSNSNILPGLFELNNYSNNYTINPILQEATKYPVYELNIASGKYSADSIVKYMLSALDNLKSRIYDYSKGIFYTDSSFNKFIDLNNEFGINQESKFVISVNKSVNSILFKQYKKIFDAHKNTSVVKGKIAYYNEGFPYIYFNIPQISIINNSLIYLAGGGSLANVSGAVTRGEKTAIIPPNYKIRIRQLLPLPRSDAVKNTQNMFTKEDFVDVTDSEIYNKYVDFINQAVNDNNTKDLSANYIIKRIFGIGESNYIDFKNLSEDKIKYLAEEFQVNSIAMNSSNITENNLKKSYLNNYGYNTTYNEIDGYNNEKNQLHF
jgi:hypothetical protein